LTSENGMPTLWLPIWEPTCCVVQYFLALTCGEALSQSCIDHTSLLENSSDTQPVGTDGIVHTTYAFVDSSGNSVTPDPTVAAAMASAAAEWNGQKGTSNIELDPLPAGQAVSSANIQVKATTDASGATGGCAAYSPSTSRISYGQTFLQAAQSLSVGTTILAHELGHALGLADGGTNPSPPSIMNNPSNALPGACTSPQVPTSTVQSNDASEVAVCRVAARNSLAIQNQREGITTSPNNDPTPVYTFHPTCTYIYSTEYFYVDGELDSTEPYVSSYTCTA